MRNAYKDSGSRLNVMWSLERLMHDDGKVEAEAVIHLFDGPDKLVSVRAANVAELCKEMIAGADAAVTRLDEPGQQTIGSMTLVPKQRVKPSKTS